MTSQPKPGDPYDVIARYYDIENAGLEEDLPAYTMLAERFDGPVLDVGCGTGRVSLALVKEGHRVVGIDSSAPMLERARKRAAEEKIDPALIEWHEAHAGALALEERFGLAILSYNTFMHVTRQSEQIAVLERIAAHLKPGGGLAIDLPNPIPMFLGDDAPGLVVERTFADPDSGGLVIQQSLARLNRATQVMEVTWVYDHVQPDGMLHRETASMRLRYTFPQEMRLLVARAGFGVAELYGDYDFEPYVEESPHLFVVTTRGGGS